jgi:hypothetical protein
MTYIFRSGFWWLPHATEQCEPGFVNPGFEVGGDPTQAITPRQTWGTGFLATISIPLLPSGASGLSGIVGA